MGYQTSKLGLCICSQPEDSVQSLGILVSTVKPFWVFTAADPIS